MREVATAQNLVELSHSEYIFAYSLTVYNLGELFVQPADHWVRALFLRLPTG
jgi:hypothetical protein